MLIMIIMFMMFLLISMILMLINLILQKKKINNREKLTPFECGFDPISSPRLPLSIQFYMISIIFLIFDIEIIIFLPIMSSYLTNKFSNWMETSLIFIMILLMGIYIEWHDGALTWLK